MLSEITRKEIEEKFGKEIRYSTDCEALSEHFYKETKHRISTSTLKRVLGFVNGTKEPRLYTLDVIAQYLGFFNWDLYLEKFAKVENSEFLNLEHVNIEALNVNCRIELTYEPNRRVVLIYEGDFVFTVTDAENSKLQKGDKLKIMNMIKHYPMVISLIDRGGKNLGQFKAGKISGIKNINILEN